jgi:hypothetical protein
MKAVAVQSPAFRAPLDPGFEPAFLFNRNHLRRLRASGKGLPLVLGLERECGLVSRFETWADPAADPATVRRVERIVKFLLWSRGGWKLHFGGPPAIGEAIRRTYSPRGARKFDCAMMALAYGKKFEVSLTTADKVPAAREMEAAAGGHLKGCRIGFDLGASDYKVSAVIDGEAVFKRIAGEWQVPLVVMNDGDMLIIGRVTTGGGGDIVLEKAREVLRREFPETAGKITMHVPDEKSRRVGLAVAAASLPKLSKNNR